MVAGAGPVGSGPVRTAPVNGGLDPDQVARARTLLHEQRAAAYERLGALVGDVAAIIEAAQDSNADDEHDPEGATIAFERERTAAFASQTEQRLHEIDAALARLDSGDYGICTVCREPIPWARLEARATATTHVEHST